MVMKEDEYSWGKEIFNNVKKNAQRGEKHEIVSDQKW